MYPIGVMNNTWNSLAAGADYTYHFFHKFDKISDFFFIFMTNIDHIWNQHGNCIKTKTIEGTLIKMSTNKWQPMFGPVVLEIACDIFRNKTSSFH